MKLGFGRRLCLVVLMLACIALSLAAIALVWYAPLYDLVLDYATRMVIPWYVAAIVTAVALAALVMAFVLLFMGARKKTPEDILVRSDEGGKVIISTQAVSALVQSAVKPIAELRDMRVRILPRERSVDIEMKVIVRPETDIPAVTEKMQQDIRSYVGAHTGIGVGTVNIAVVASPAQGEEVSLSAAARVR
nr:alkaline shock response membrane anchor protein AmaP [Maliibacterium massiliense]